MIRMVAVIQAGTRHLVDAVFGTDQISELAYAAQLTPVLTPGMLVLGDRNFSASTFLAQVADTGADFLIRGKTGTTAKKFPVLTRHPDGSYLSTTGTIQVRIIDAEVTITTEVGHRTVGYRLITSLLDPAEADARCLIELYHQRWEIETAYCDLKSTMLGGRVLRGRHPAAVTQALWAVLCVYQALRIAMVDAVVTRPDVGVDRLSLTTALLTARDQLIRAQKELTVTITGVIGVIGAAVVADPLPARRVHTGPRAIKRAISKYRATARTIDRTTYPAIVTAVILTPEPPP